jgi:hypothetical protein
MRTTSLFRVVSLLLLGAVFLTSCNPAANSPTPSQVNTSASTMLTKADDSVTEMPDVGSPTEGDTPTPTQPQPTPTPIVEMRLPPEQWREWPVVPELTGREVAIYQRGMSMGNDPTHFSKVGDCQAIKDVLMGIYDQPDRYNLTEEQAYLQETIDNFSGSFDRDGQAVRGGYSAAAVLSPIWADSEACNPGETPIECEYRIHKPSIVIISLEVWWEGRTVERYEEYMRQIIEFHIDNGVVPILSTKADNVEGDHRINLATARLAYEYHIPLWNFWRAVQPLPHQGIDPDRDGFHISYEAWTVRSFTALQALNAVWRGVREGKSNPNVVLETPTPEVEFAEINIAPTPIDPTVSLDNDVWVFSLTQRSSEATRSAGVYTYDPTEGTLRQVFGEGYVLEDADQKNLRLLVSLENQLFISDLAGNTQFLTNKFAQTGREKRAGWLHDERKLLVLTDEGDKNALWLLDPEVEDWELLAEGSITGILPSNQTDVYYWYQGKCDLETPCESDTVWRTTDGVSELLAEVNMAAFDSTGETYAWVENAESTTVILYIRSIDQTNQSYVYLPGNRVVDLAWAHADDRLALLSVTRSDYSGKSSDARIFIVDTTTMSHLEYAAFPGLNPRLYWHEDGGALLLTSTLSTESGYSLYFRRMDLNSGFYDTLDKSLTIESKDFITFEKLFWLFP